MELEPTLEETRGANGMQCRPLQRQHTETSKKTARLLKGLCALIVSPFVFVDPIPSGPPTQQPTGRPQPQPLPLPIALSLTTPIEIVRGAYPPSTTFPDVCQPSCFFHPHRSQTRQEHGESSLPAMGRTTAAMATAAVFRLTTPTEFPVSSLPGRPARSLSLTDTLKFRADTPSVDRQPR